LPLQAFNATARVFVASAIREYVTSSEPGLNVQNIRE
jgi:hypothetical protein